MAYKHLISKNMINKNIRGVLKKMRMNGKEIWEWIRNKKIRVWRRALYEVYSEGPLSLSFISDTLDSDPIRKNHKWDITDAGVRKVENDQKYGSMPILHFGNNY